VLGLIRGPAELGLAVARGALQLGEGVVRVSRDLAVRDPDADRYHAVVPPVAPAVAPHPHAMQEPWEDYSRQDARAIVQRLSTVGSESAVAVELYESAHRKRRPVLDAARRRLRVLSGPAAGEKR
jgi:hypothetical protein